MSAPVLRVSLSTDAVIYLPFYLAYFGGDFNETPFEAVDVKIVGLDDPRFNSQDEFKVKKNSANELKPRLRGDAAMTLDVLLDVADIGIGDPGFACMLRNEKKSLYNTVFDRAGCISYLKYFDIDQLQDSSDIKRLQQSVQKDEVGILLQHMVGEKKDLRVLSGLIRKPGLKAIVGQSKEDFYNSNKNLPSSQYSNKDILRKCADKLTKKYSYFTYPNPATSDLYARKELKLTNTKKNLDFGVELQNLTPDEICLSCDFIAIDYLHNEEKNFIVDDLVTDETTTLMWSGIIADYKKYEKNKKPYKAFLYAIDKVLFELNTFVQTADRLGFEQYVYAKLSKNTALRSYIINVLIADHEISDKFQKIPNPIPQIVRQIADNFFRWRGKTVSLYYASSVIATSAKQREALKKKSAPFPDGLFDDQECAKCAELTEIIKLRDDKFDDTTVNNLIFPDILEDWRKAELRISRIRRWLKPIFNLINNKNFWEGIAIVFAFLSLLGFIDGLFDPIFTHICKSYEFVIIGAIMVAALMFLAVKFFTRNYKYVYHYK